MPDNTSPIDDAELQSMKRTALDALSAQPTSPHINQQLRLIREVERSRMRDNPDLGQRIWQIEQKNRRGAYV